jgi:peptide/nickel transport system permease protein
MQQLTQFELVWRRFRRNRLAMAGLVVFALLVLMAIAAPLITRVSPTTAVKQTSGFGLIEVSAPPSLTDFPNLLLGTDSFGRSIWSGVAYGARLSLGISVAAALGASLLGTIVGALSGYYAGLSDFDIVVMHLADIVLAIPLLPLLIMIAVFFVRGDVVYTIVVFILAGWPQPARLVRSAYLSLREQGFVEAARAGGVSELRIIFRHMLPNVLGLIVVITTLNLAALLVLEATLDYLEKMKLHQPPAPRAAMPGWNDERS